MRRPPPPVIAAAATILCAGAAIAWIVLGNGADEADQELTGSALVSLAPIQSGPIETVLDATGLAQSDPGGTVTIAAPRAAVVQKVMVRVGEAVRAGQALVVIGDAPGAGLAYAQARHARDFARIDLDRVKRLADAHLAANDQVSQAQRTFEDAQAAVLAQEAQGGGQLHQVLSAPADGVVLTTPVSPGDRVAEAADLVTISGSKAAVVKLWVNPGDSQGLVVGASVRVAPVFGDGAFQARLNHVGRLVDGSTHMLDAEAPVAGLNLAVGAPVRAQIVLGSHTGFSVPREAVVFDDTGSHIFTISGGKATRVDVTAGHEQNDRYEITGALKVGQSVAVNGAAQLEDGMAVRTRPQ